MTIDFRYARLGLIAGLACVGSVTLAKQTVLPKDAALPAKAATASGKSDDNHGNDVSEAAKGGTKGPELAELAKKNKPNPPGHDHDSDDDHDHGKGNDDHDHGHGHPRSPH